MFNVKSYLISICISAIICCVLSNLTGEKGTIGSIIKLLCGLFMLMTALSPVIQMPIYEFQNYFNQLSMDAEYAASIGQNAAKEEIDSIVISKAEAAIAEKASKLGVTLDVELSVHDSVPKAVRISGAISPYKKQLLSKYIQDHLGIAVEDQQWIS